MRTAVGIVALVVMLIASAIPLASLGASPPNVPMGTFEPDPQATTWGANPSDIGKWFSASWGINQAYQVGAVSYPYQFLYGDFYQNGQEVVQAIDVEFSINWSVVKNYPGLADFLPIPGYGATVMGAPTWESISTGIGSGVVNYDSGYPIRVYFTQNNTVLEQNVSTSANVNQYSVPVFIPTSAAQGPFYIIFEAQTYNMWGQKAGYEPIYIGEGAFNALSSHVSGKPTSVVNSLSSQTSALLNWSFSAGEWNVTFVHYLNDNPSDNASSNIQVLAYYNFTYKQTGGAKDLRYNFSSTQPSGVYGWRFHEGITNYGASFIVYNNASSVLSGDKLPMISIYIKQSSQGQNEIVSIIAKDNRSSWIDLEVSVWYGSDPYTVPNPSYENVLYYFAPYNVSNGQNISLPSFSNIFYGELNVEVISHNSYNLWNNSYAQSIVKSNIYQNGTGGGNLFQSKTAWLVEPFASPINALFLVGGIGILLWSIHRSGIESETIKKAMRGLAQPSGGIYLPTHYLAAFVLIILSLINWSLVIPVIMNWGGLAL
jgi:hypothetical protein